MTAVNAVEKHTVPRGAILLYSAAWAHPFCADQLQSKCARLCKRASILCTLQLHHSFSPFDTHTTFLWGFSLHHKIAYSIQTVKSCNLRPLALPDCVFFFFCRHEMLVLFSTLDSRCKKLKMNPASAIVFFSSPRKCTENRRKRSREENGEKEREEGGAYLKKREAH